MYRSGTFSSIVLILAKWWLRPDFWKLFTSFSSRFTSSKRTRRSEKQKIPRSSPRRNKTQPKHYKKRCFCALVVKYDAGHKTECCKQYHRAKLKKDQLFSSSCSFFILWYEFLSISLCPYITSSIFRPYENTKYIDHYVSPEKRFINATNAEQDQVLQYFCLEPECYICLHIGWPMLASIPGLPEIYVCLHICCMSIFQIFK